jgi:hypothetical protein
MRIYVVLNLLGRWNFCKSDDLVVMRGWLETPTTLQKFPPALELRSDTIYLYYYSQSLFFQWPYKDDQWKKSLCYCYLSMVHRTKFGHIGRCKSSKLSIKVLIGSGSMKAGCGRGFHSHPVHFYHLVEYGIGFWFRKLSDKTPNRDTDSYDFVVFTPPTATEASSIISDLVSIIYKRIRKK